MTGYMSLRLLQHLHQVYLECCEGLLLPLFVLPTQFLDCVESPDVDRLELDYLFYDEVQGLQVNHFQTVGHFLGDYPFGRDELVLEDGLDGGVESRFQHL